MTDNDALLEIAAALADGERIDWESAAQGLSDADDRWLLAELLFIARVTSTAPESGAETTAPGEFWGPLQIVEHVGRGTFGDVYRAWDSRLDREVALKILRRKERDDLTDASTIVEEGRLLARVRHPNVATVYGAERIGGRVGVWMEFVQGRTLEQELREQGPFAVDRVVSIGLDLSSALTAIHRAGLIHRDVKAQNVLCDRDGRIVLTDFGAGCEVDESGTSVPRSLAGTPISVAPEILDGQAASPRTDVYSLGVLLYHLATGTYPVRGRSLKEIREAHAARKRTPIDTARPDLPEAFVRIVERATDPEPARRYENPETLLSKLRTLTAPRRALSGRRWRTAVATLALFAAASAWFVFGSATFGRADSSAAALLSPETELVEVVNLTEEGRLEEAYERALRMRAAAPGSLDAAIAVSYVLTYAGCLDEAATAIGVVLAADPEYVPHNGWWTPTAYLYQRDFDRFLLSLRGIDAPFIRLYRALAEVERGHRAGALTHLEAIDSSMNVFNGLARALRAGLTGGPDEAGVLIQSISEQRRAAADNDGEVTFKQAQILAVAGDLPAALTTLSEAAVQGFVCVACFETSTMLEPVRSLDGYRAVRARALTRQQSFALRFGLAKR